MSLSLLSLFLFPPSLPFSWLSDHFSSKEARHPSPFLSSPSIPSLLLLFLLLWHSSYQRNDNTTSLCNLAEEGCSSAHTHTELFTFTIAAFAKTKSIFHLSFSPSFFVFCPPSLSLSVLETLMCASVSDGHNSHLQRHTARLLEDLHSNMTLPITGL